MVQVVQLHSGQCGLCQHFGEHQAAEQPQLIQIRLKKEAPEDLIESCGHPNNVQVDLKVTPTSGCAGFTPAPPEA